MTNFSPDFIQSQLALAQNYPAALAEILALRAAVEEKDAEIKSALRAERDAALERLQEYRDDTARVINEKCPTDERHCGCVPILRKANHCYRNALVLITTMTDVSEMRTIADKALSESLADVSAAKACGEYWVQQLEQKEYSFSVERDAALAFLQRLVGLGILNDTLQYQALLIINKTSHSVKSDDPGRG